MNIIAFSKNRACQLDLALRSLQQLNVKNKKIRVVYTYDPEYKDAYDEVIRRHADVEFVLESDFKKDVIGGITDEYFMFLIDDDVMIDSYDENCQEFLEFTENEEILCLNLRMARNYDYDYLKDKQVPIPEFKNGMWEWKRYKHDWGYPMAASAHIFRTKDLFPILEREEFTNPNSLEHNMRWKLDKPYMLGFEKAKFVNIPINRVGSNPQRISGSMSASYLNDKFMNGYIVDLDSVIEEAKKSRSYFVPIEEFKWIKYEDA